MFLENMPSKMSSFRKDKIVLHCFLSFGKTTCPEEYTSLFIPAFLAHDLKSFDDTFIVSIKPDFSEALSAYASQNRNCF